MAEDRFELTILTRDGPKDVTFHVLEYNFELSYMDLIDKFSIKLYAEFDQKVRLLFYTMPWNMVTIKINGYKQMEGIITKQSVNDTGVITISGQDYLGVFMSSSIGKVVIPNGINIGDALLKGLKQFGITEIENGFNANRYLMCGGNDGCVVDPKTDYKTIKVTEKHGKQNESVQQFCLRILKRSGLFILPSGERHKVALSFPEYDQKPVCELIRRQDGFGNIISGQVVRDFTNVPTTITWKGAPPIKGDNSYLIDENINIGQKYLIDTSTLPDTPRRKRTTLEYPVFGQESPHPIGRNIEVMQQVADERVILNQADTGSPANIINGIHRVYRPLVVDDTESKTPGEMHKFAMRELGKRLRSTLQVTYTVAGHSYPKTGAIYAIDTLALVQDAVSAIKYEEPLWINKVTHSRSRNSGAQTEIELWRKNSYLQGEQE